MTRLSLTPALLTGIGTIDAQHKRLVALANRFHDATAHELDEAALRGLLEELLRYTSYHFATEEKFMVKYGYPEAEPHREQHQSFVDRARDFLRRFDAGEDVLADAGTFLVTWVTRHIAHTDRQLGSFLRRQGLG